MLPNTDVGGWLLMRLCCSFVWFVGSILKLLLRIRCIDPVGSGVTAMAATVVLRARGIEASPFFLDETGKWEDEACAATWYMRPPPQNVAHQTHPHISSTFDSIR